MLQLIITELCFESSHTVRNVLTASLSMDACPTLFSLVCSFTFTDSSKYVLISTPVSSITCFIELILQIELRNNRLEMQSVCSEALIEELDKLLERLRIPSEVCLNSLSL